MEDELDAGDEGWVVVNSTEDEIPPANEVKEAFEFTATHYINSTPVMMIKVPNKWPKYLDSDGNEVRHGKGAKPWKIGSPIPSDALGTLKTGQAEAKLPDRYIMVSAEDAAAVLRANLYPCPETPIGHAINPNAGSVVDNIGEFTVNLCRKELDGMNHQYVIRIPKEFPFEVVSVH